MDTGSGEQLLYLVHISQLFSSLAKAAAGGIYSHKFFGDPKIPAEYPKRLRAVVQNLLLQFAEDMRCKGHEQEITEDGRSKDNETSPRHISRLDFIEDVRELMRRLGL